MLSDDLEGDMEEGGLRVGGGYGILMAVYYVYMYNILMADSCCCVAETNSTL